MLLKTLLSTEGSIIFYPLQKRKILITKKDFYTSSVWKKKRFFDFVLPEKIEKLRKKYFK